MYRGYLSLCTALYRSLSSHHHPLTTAVDGTFMQLISSQNHQGAKKIIFTACHSDKLKLTFTNPEVISTSPKAVWRAELILRFFCHLNSSKKITCPSGKLKTEFTSPIAKSTSPGLSDTTFFACCTMIRHCWTQVPGIKSWITSNCFRVC